MDDNKIGFMISKMCSLLSLDHSIHKTECFMFKGFFHNNLPPNIRTHLMREDIKDHRKLAAKADKIWHSASDWRVNVFYAASPSGQVPKEAALKALHQCPPPYPAPSPAPHAARPPALSSSQNFNKCWYHCNHGD